MGNILQARTQGQLVVNKEAMILMTMKLLMIETRREDHQ